MLIGTSLPAILLAKQSAAIMIDAPVSPLSMHVPKSLFLSSILAICGATNPIKLMIPVTPVSYTHLDVYKRQIPFQSSLAASEDGSMAAISRDMAVPPSFIRLNIRASSSP